MTLPQIQDAGIAMLKTWNDKAKTMPAKMTVCSFGRNGYLTASHLHALKRSLEENKRFIADWNKALENIPFGEGFTQIPHFSWMLEEANMRRVLDGNYRSAKRETKREREEREQKEIFRRNMTNLT